MDERNGSYRADNLLICSIHTAAHAPGMILFVRPTYCTLGSRPFLVSFVYKTAARLFMGSSDFEIIYLHVINLYTIKYFYLFLYD